jgi:hypothetical protein
MNKERFLELAEQAGFIFWADEDWRPKGNTIDWSSNYDEELAKFAELIVRECIGCCEQVISDPVPKDVDTWLNGGEQCIQEIKEHFGLGMSVEDKKQLIKELLGVNKE